MRTSKLRTSALVVVGLLSAAGSKAETIGDPVIQRPTFDGGTGQLFVYSDFFSTPGRVTSWSFFSDNTATNSCSTGQDSYACYPGATITPILLRRNPADIFEVIGIGTTRSNSLTGQQTFAFGLTAGSDLVYGDVTFGFRSGGPQDTGDFDFGVVQFDDSPGPGFHYMGERTTFMIGTTFGAGANIGRRYSIQFTAVPVGVPEPSAALLIVIAPIAVLYPWKGHRALRRRNSVNPVSS